MERNRPATLNQGVAEVPGRSSGVDVASRRAALESLQSAVFRGPAAGPLLITGESGAGKTRLWGRLAEEAPAHWRFAVVQASPALDAADFLGLAVARLGGEPSGRPAADRLAVASTLQDESTDGRSWALVVENAHHAAPDVWAELEAMTAGGAGGARREFAAILLVGRTELVRRMAARPLQGFASRLGGHVHLSPLDVDEAAQLLAASQPDRPDADRIERLHRDAAGNPRAILRLLEPKGPGRRAPTPAPRRPEPAPTFAVERRPEVVRAPAAAPAPLVPSRPPLREEDGLIEVGWSGSLEAEGESAAVADPPKTPAREAVAVAAEPGPPGEEAIEDHYAALQAWTEWARNRDRLNPDPQPAHDPVEEPEPEDRRDEDDRAGADLGAGLRAETEHDHAPFSQLFSRLEQPR